MALAAKKVSQSVVVVILLLFSTASFSAVHARSTGHTGIIQSRTLDDKEDDSYWKSILNLDMPQGGRKYQTYRVLLRERPSGEAIGMDDKDARRRWYESFLPSTLTDSGEPRLLHCHTFDVNGFLAMLTWAEALALANKQGVVRRMVSDYLGPFVYSPASCGFVTAITKRSFIRSKPAF